MQIAEKAIEKLAERISRRLADNGNFVETVAYRVALETVLSHSGADAIPSEIFRGISDEFWLWLHTEGYRRSHSLRTVLPAVADEDIQLRFTGDKGDGVLKGGHSAYLLFRDLYEKHGGSLRQCDRVLDFGCGWGRIIRFFIRELDASRLWGCDPVEEMIELCKKQNKWCNFQKIATKPPTPFDSDSFDLIYGYSVFSHLSEEMHRSCLLELRRILKPGGVLIMTTRSRDFIERCADMRKRPDQYAAHSGPRSSASAFPDTSGSLALYDSGGYCFTQLVQEGEWSYWGEAAIPKSYVLKHWTPHFTLLDYVDDRGKCEQDVIVVRKPSSPKT